MKTTIFLIVFGLIISISRGSVTISVPSAGNCGEDTVLTCHVTESIGSTGWSTTDSSIVINGAPVSPEDNNKYTETKGTSFFTLTIHNTDITDEMMYGCYNGFSESTRKSLKIQCKASAAALTVPNSKKVAIAVDKLYHAALTAAVTFKKENSVVTVPGSSKCFSSINYTGYYRCIWTSSNSLAEGSYTYSLIVTTITQADPLTGSFKIVSPQTLILANDAELNNRLYVNEGQTLTLECISRGGYPAPTVVLYKNIISGATQLASIDTGNLQSDNTYSVSLQHTFTPSKSDDRKQFICRSYYPQADSAYRDSKNKSVILYLTSFFVKGREAERSVTVNEYANVQLICFADSTAKIMFKDKIVKEGDNSNTTSLTFIRRSISCTHSGVYTCEGGDLYDRFAMNVTLNVRCAPRPLRQAKQEVSSRLNVPVTFTFTAIAFPEPGPAGFSWNKETDDTWTPLLSNEDIQIESSELQSNLTIFTVTQQDFGKYRVTAKNDIGSYDQFMVLVEEGGLGQHTIECSENTVIITGTILGIAAAAFAVYSVSLTIWVKRNWKNKGKLESHNTRKEQTYANESFIENVGAEQIDIKDTQYTSLDDAAKDRNVTYETLQTA